MPENRRLLVVAAHPDDEVLGCAATVCKLVQQGWQAHLVVMTSGIAGRHASDATAAEGVRGQQDRLRAELHRAAEVVGYCGIDTFDFPDNRMDTLSRSELVHAIRPVIEKVAPSLVFTHHPGDYNWDHTQVFDAVMMAARCNPPDFSPAEIRTFEVLSSTERAWQEPSRAFHPNLYVNVAATIDMKKLALRYYETEYRAYPHPRSIEAIEYQARRRGNEAGLQYAEAFHIIRRVEA